MPLANGAFWIAAGVTAATGAAAFIYWRNTNRSVTETNTKVLKIDDQMAARSKSAASRGSGFQAGLKKLIRERKMVFVVNRPILMNKQVLFVSVSTACLRYYRSVMKNREYFEANVKPWTRTGQMKVVLKANSADELKSILERCRADGIEALLLNVGDLCPRKAESEPVEKGKKVDNGSPLDNEDPMTPVVLCVLAPTDKLDQITGHLKLL